MKEIQLYNGVPPGSETWDWAEKANNKNSVGVLTVYNVARPTLTVYSADPEIANGSGVIICPGGGFHFLAFDHEGTNIAERLVKKGYTVFILKYRTLRIFSDNPFDAMIAVTDMKAWDDEALPVIPLAIADGRNAIEYVRQRSEEFNIRSERIGIMGFSAGGMVAAATAFNYSSLNKPDFVALVYADIPQSIQSSVHSDAPPLFLACAQDDEFGFVTHATSIYKKWYEMKRPAEMHLFSGGGHGFGIGCSANTTHNWLDLFCEWESVTFNV
jgi:acetyl esterase/lipase